MSAVAAARAIVLNPSANLVVTGRPPLDSGAPLSARSLNRNSAAIIVEVIIHTTLYAHAKSFFNLKMSVASLAGTESLREQKPVSGVLFWPDHGRCFIPGRRGCRCTANRCADRQEILRFRHFY